MPLKLAKNENPKLVSYLLILPDSPTPNGPEQLYLLIKEVLTSANITRPKVVLELIGAKDKGAAFILNASTEIASLVKHQLRVFWPGIDLIKLTDRHKFSPNKDSRIKVHRWTLGRHGLLNPMSELIAVIPGLSNKDWFSWRVVIECPKEKTLVMPLKLTALVLIRFLKFIFLIFIDSFTDLSNSYQRAANRALKQRKINESDFRVSILSVCSGDSENKLTHLDKTISAVLKSRGYIPARLNPGKLEDYLSNKQSKPINLTAYTLAKVFSLPEPNEVIKANVSIDQADKLPPIVGKAAKVDLVLGFNHISDKLTAVGLSRSSRQKHLLVIGGTGTGKSSLLGYCFVQDMLAKHGVALIDPHGDLARKMMAYVPSDRLDDVIYIDPTDINFPVSINLMELPSGLSQTDKELAKDLITEAIVSIFRKIFSEDDSGGHRIEYILRNTIHTAFSVPGANLFTLNKLLSNDLYRASIVAQLNDDSLKDFWFGEFNKAGSYQKVKMISGVTAKLGRFQRSLITRRMLERAHSTIDFYDLINSRKILICNFSKGVIGEDTSSLLGMLILAKLQLAAWQRSLIPGNKRTPFYLYLDEIQDLSTLTINQLIAQSRKFALYLTLAEQTSAYQSEQEANIMLANVGSIACFRTASAIDARRIGPIFKGRIKADDLAGLDQFEFYLKTEDNLMVSATTSVIKAKPNYGLLNKAIERSRSNYSFNYEIFELKTNRVIMRRNLS